MERELIIPVKNMNYDKHAVEILIEFMQKNLRSFESFSTFRQVYDVKELSDQKWIRDKTTLRIIFDKGVAYSDNYIMTFGKN